MDWRIEFEPGVERELDAYYEFYEERATGLGYKFREPVDQHISVIQKHPVMRARYDEIRCVPIIGFPFMLHYSIIPARNVIRINAVIHTSRNPLSNWNNMNWIVSEDMPAYGLHAYDMEYYYAA